MIVELIVLPAVVDPRLDSTDLRGAQGLLIERHSRAQRRAGHFQI
jgi:hypothetical protein